MYCPNCEHKFSDGVDTCPKCGTRVDIPTKNMNTKQGDSKLFYMFTLILTILWIVSVLYLFIGASDYWIFTLGIQALIFLSTFFDYTLTTKSYGIIKPIFIIIVISLLPPLGGIFYYFSRK